MVYQLDCGTYWVYVPVNRGDTLGPRRAYYQYAGKSYLEEEGGFRYLKHRIEKAFINYAYVKYPVFGREHIES